MRMTEETLSYLWRFQRFSRQNLKTSDGKQLTIYNPGTLNSDSGPDFSDARIRLDTIEWCGNIELHVNSSDWRKHGHQNDEAYRNVILHVVWNHDQEVNIGDYKIPVLELKGTVAVSLLSKVETLIKNITDIPCSSFRIDWSGVHQLSALENATVQRLQRKCAEIQLELESLKGDWEEAFYRRFTANLGFKVNKDPFYALAKGVSQKLIAKYSFSPPKVESLLMGVAGFLNQRIHDEYYLGLRTEFNFLQKKHNLSPIDPGWKFMRMRPANFPTVRISQLAAIYDHNQNLFRKLIEISNYSDIVKILRVETADYWKSHYLFGEESKSRNTALGKASIDLITINTIVPFLFSYGVINDLNEFKDKAINLLQAIQPEKNRITKRWGKAGLKLNSAFSTQGSIELFENYCRLKKCLQCKIGVTCLSENQS